jgi:azurin
MKYSVTTIEAKAGESLKIVLTNIGTLPKEAMGHNWVLLKAGNDGAAFSAAAIMAKDTDYIPVSLKDQVIAEIGTLGPRKSGEVDFIAPAPGEYVFLCSFPAHFAVGMKGKLIVR